MVRDLLGRYIWMVDTIERYGRITREKFNELWAHSPYGNGEPMPRRSFYNYRNGIEEAFGIVIGYDPSTFEYFIDNHSDSNEAARNRWLIDSVSVSGMLGDARNISGRVVLENVPSSRRHLATVLDAMKQGRRLRFSYRSYNESTPKDRQVNPYFVKIFKQLWYLIGYNVDDKAIKTYSLDRMGSVSLTEAKFEMPPNFNPEDFFADSFGIITDSSRPERVTLRVSRWLANYLRALPLHKSQREEIHENYSLFHYRMQVTSDLIEEIMRYGSNITVLEPKELRLRVTNELRKCMENYTLH